MINIVNFIFGMWIVIYASAGSSGELEDARKNLLLKFFKSDIDDFYQLTYAQIPSRTLVKQLLSPSSGTLAQESNVRLFANSGGYLLSNYPQSAIRGQAVSFFHEENELPIGYQIYVPENPHAIIVEVYGGNILFDSKNSFRPFHQALVQAGYVVIQLNLVDAHEKHPLGLGSIKQQQTPIKTFDAVQQSIHKFLSILKNDPAFLHRELEQIKNLPTFLLGHSFGGLVTIRHAELFSDNSFDGYIGINSGLLGDMPGWKESRQRIFHLDNVYDENEIAKITKPILLIHAVTDANVNVEITNKWARKARKILSNNKVPFAVFYSNKVNPKSGKGEGHFLPEAGPALDEFIDQIKMFTAVNADGEKFSRTHAETGLTVYRQKLFSNKFLRESTMQKRFLSEGFKKYLELSSDEEVRDFSADWRDHYEPLWNVIYIFEKFIRQADKALLKQRDATEFDKFLGKKDSEEFNLAFALWSIRETGRNETAIKNAFLADLPAYLSYIRVSDPNYIKGQFPDIIDDEFLASLAVPEVLEAYWSVLTSPHAKPYRSRYMMALSFFQTNPHMIAYVERYTNKFWWNTTNKSLRELFAPRIENEQREALTEKEFARNALEKAILKYIKKENAVNRNP